MPPTEAEIAAAEQAKKTETVNTEKSAADAKAKADAEAAGKPKEEITVAEALKGKKPEGEAAKMVPEAVLIEVKKENKQLAKDLETANAKIAAGQPKSETTADLKAIAAKHNVDLSFLEEIAAAIQAKAKVEAEEVATSKVKPLEAKDEAARIDRVFGEHYDRALEQLPEFKDVANRDVIKTLTLDPKNANKTFSQILDEAYGHLIKGKRSIEAAKPSGQNRDSGPVDVERAGKDQAYFKEIMADPIKKAEYNKTIEKRLPL